MARVHVRSWQQAYRGLIPDAFLDDPGFIARRTAFWQTLLTDPKYSGKRISVAEEGHALIGIAMADVAASPAQLDVLYVLDSHHGSGAGSALLESVLPTRLAAELWVADPNPRAQAFYRKHGFTDTSQEQIEDGVREIRLRRDGSLRAECS